MRLLLLLCMTVHMTAAAFSGTPRLEIFSDGFETGTVNAWPDGVLGVIDHNFVDGDLALENGCGLLCMEPLGIPFVPPVCAPLTETTEAFCVGLLVPESANRAAWPDSTLQVSGFMVRIQTLPDLSESLTLYGAGVTLTPWYAHSVLIRTR